jgi:hypothetical protein
MKGDFGRMSEKGRIGIERRTNLLELLDGTLVNTTALVDQVTSL